MAEPSNVRAGAADEAALFQALREQLGRATSAQPYWIERLAGINIGAITSREQLASLPLLHKSDLIRLQKAAPPFGGLAATPAGQLARLFVSPGPIFDPEGRGEDWWGAARALAAAGVGPGDIVLNTFSYHLTPAGAMFETGAHALGCAVIPAGPGNTADQLVVIRQFQPTVYIGTPDFLKILLDKADEAGIDAACIGCAVVSGAALPPSLRRELEGKGITIVQCYGTADLGIIAYEDKAEGLAINDGLIVEIVRPGTGDTVKDGEVGEIVVTRLNRDYPLLRFATGDLSRLLPAGADGRPRIAGWMGRADQATKVRGMFVRPEQVAEIGRKLGISGRMRLVVTRKDEQDDMLLLIEHDDASIADRAAAQSTETMRLKSRVEIVTPGFLPNDGKVIIDER